MEGRLPTSKDADVLIPGMCDYVILHGKGEFRLQLELKLLTLKQRNLY